MTRLDDDIYKVLGINLKKIRNKQKISLRELSNKMDNSKSKSMLQRYEDGLSYMTIDTLIDICNALNVDYKMVIDEVRMITSHGGIDDFSIYATITEDNSEGLLIAKKYMDSDDKTKKVIKALLDLDF